MMGRALGLALAFAVLAPAANAAELGMPDKVIALIPAAGCDLAVLTPKLTATARAFARDRHVTGVTIDWPANPASNLDLRGQPSAFVAALEVKISPARTRELAERVAWAMRGICSAAVYSVHERRLMATPRTWALGESSPRTKTLVTLRRLPRLTQSQFAKAWTVDHAELAMGWRRERGGDGHYVQNLVIDRVDPDSPELDGIGEGEGPGDAPGPQERAARMKTAADAATFQDLPTSQMFVARETIIKDEAGR